MRIFIFSMITSTDIYLNIISYSNVKYLNKFQDVKQGLIQIISLIGDKVALVICHLAAALQKLGMVHQIKICNFISSIY